MGTCQQHVCCSTGLLAALRCPDWPVRRATAEAIKALAVALGPQLEAANPAVASHTMTAAAADALDKCRFDKMRPVRDSVQEAQAVLQDLQVCLHCTLVLAETHDDLCPLA